MTTFHRIACFVFVATLAPALHAKPQCPASVTSLHFRPGHGSQIIAPVMIDQTGPYDFLVDTGAQVTIIDSSLAASLHLNQEGAAQLVGIGFHEQAGFVQTASFALGSEEVTGLRVLVRSAALSNSADPAVRGILGGDFLGRFDLLIDNAHQVLCLTSSDALRSEFRSNHIELRILPGRFDDPAIPRPPVIAVRLSGLSATQDLLLDSGANVSLLYGGGAQLPAGPGSATLRGTGAGGGIRNFTALPAQDLRIGASNLAHVTFVALREGRSDVRPGAADGLLTTGIFRRVFISCSQGFAVVEPW